MELKSNAKINLFLDVAGKRDDGYHDLKMIMIPITLHDTLEYDKINWTKSHIICDSVALAPDVKYNLIDKTIKLIKDKYEIQDNFNVVVHKEIPMCAGLGGGSSNAATTFRFLNKYCKIGLTNEALATLGLSLGADIPFFIYNKPALVEGIGEKIQPISIKKTYYVLIIMPPTGLSTKVVFEAADKKQLKHGDINKVIKGLELGDDNLIKEGMMNSLEDVAFDLLPETKKIKDMMIADGLELVMMSGSGSSVFALSDKKKMIKKLYKKYENEGYNVFLSKTIK